MEDQQEEITIHPNAKEYTVSELKEILRSRGLSTTGVKAELIARLYEKDPGGGGGGVDAVASAGSGYGCFKTK